MSRKLNLNRFAESPKRISRARYPKFSSVVHNGSSYF